MKPRQFRFLILFSYILCSLFIGYGSPVMDEGHTDVIINTVFSPDGRFILSNSSDKSIIVWDATECKAIKTISGFEFVITELLYSPDGSSIVTGDVRGNIKLWDAATGALLRSFTGHAGMLTSLDISPDGRMLISTTYLSDKVFVWDMEKGSIIRRLDMVIEPHEITGVKGASFSPDGQFIAAANGNTTVHVWNATTGAHLYELEKAAHFPNKVHYNPNGESLISSGDGDVAAVLWEASTGRELSFVDDSYLFRRVEAYSPDGQYVLGRYNNWFEIWDAQTLKWVADMGENRYQLTSAAYSPNGRSIVTSGLDTQALVWDAETLELSCRLGESRR